MKRWLLFFAISLILAGCASKPPIMEATNYGEYCSEFTQCNIVKKLNDRGANIYYLGDSVSIMIPVEELFSQNATVLNQKAKESLNSVARLLSCYQKMSVKIVVYANSKERLGEAEMRAIAIEHYLTTKNIDARLLYSVKKISKTDGKSSQIEVLTKRLP